MPTTSIFTDIDAILFDLDGTLIDSTPVTSRAWAAWGVEMGIGRTDFHDHGVPARQVIQGVIDSGDLDASRYQEAFDRINFLEETDTDGVSRLPGAVELLASLPAGRFTIVTSCTDALAAARLGAVGWTAPPLMVTADMVTTGKPSPEGYLLGAKRLGFDPARCLVVEDAPAGLAAGRAAGARTLALTGTYSAHELDADLVLDSLEGVLALPTTAAEPLTLVRTF